MEEEEAILGISYRTGTKTRVLGFQGRREG